MHPFLRQGSSKSKTAVAPDFKRANIFTTTFNCGNAPPPPAAVLHRWLDIRSRQPHVIAIAMQECSHVKQFLVMFKNHLHQYRHISGKQIADLKGGFIRLDLFVHADAKYYVSNIATKTENAGLAGIVGNKGGVLTRFKYCNVYLCFISSHLAAHQGKQYLEKRNQDFSKIVEGTVIDGMDALQYDHTFWMGDLNYRLDYGGQDGKSPTPQLFNEMVKLVEDGELKTLFKTDQLTAQRLVHKTAFPGWEEGDVTVHRPTFKVLRGMEEEKKADPAIRAQTKLQHVKYKSSRAPAWTDRVLWHSLPIPEMDVQQIGLSSCEFVQSSDHKPVTATFVVKVALLANVPFTITQFPRSCALIFEELAARDLVACDANGKSDPYVMFDTLRHELFRSRYRTPTIKATLNPIWDPVRLPRISLDINNPEVIARRVVLCNVFDFDMASRDDMLGGATLSLAKVALNPGAACPFELDIMRFGLPAGKLIGKVKLVYG